MKRRPFFCALALGCAALAGTHAKAMSLVPTNVVGLLSEADAIVVGSVEGLTDGIDERGIPYTEVTLGISETIRGELSGTYTFRQFGLMQPRLTADGTKKMMPAPEGFPRFAVGEHVVLFLHPRAAWTGLRTTVGLTQGKFTIGPGRLENGMGNAWLFHDIEVEQGLATGDDKRLLATEIGAVNPESFLSFVRRAVKDRWVETGRLRRTDGAPPRSRVQPESSGVDQTQERRDDAPESSPPPEAPDANRVLPRSGQRSRP